MDPVSLNSKQVSILVTFTFFISLPGTTWALFTLADKSTFAYPCFMMSRRHRMAQATAERRVNRDFELCKVVFAAAISQILYARRSFPSGCFQLLPLADIVSRSFEDLVITGSGLQTHDKELLRDHRKTVFLRQGTNYEISRFLGILREDIFPIIEIEGLAKFRINYLRAKTWKPDCLLEYYTVGFRYEPNGMYRLDICRAGTGKPHLAATDSQLWNLGDYLSQLSRWTEPAHWTLAFLATERPDEPPIGVWNFGSMDFDDANLGLQQRGEYAYTKIVCLEILPLSHSDNDDVISETSVEQAPPSSSLPEEQCARTKHNVPRVKDKGEHRKTRPPAEKVAAQDIASQQTKPTPAQLAPPLPKTSSRKEAKGNTTTNAPKALPGPGTVRKGPSQSSAGVSKPISKKGAATKRKPKRPLQLFEEAASSLPPTQIIGESQSLTQMNSSAMRNAVLGSDKWDEFIVDVPRSRSPDALRLLGNIALSPRSALTTRSTPGQELLQPQLPHLGDQQQREQGEDEETFEGSRQVGPSIPVPGPTRGMRQWEPRASPLIGIDLSDQELIETASEAAELLAQVSPENRMDSKVLYEFSPHTVARRTSLFHDILSSGDEEEL